MVLVLTAFPASAAGTPGSEGQCIFNSFKGIKLVCACLLTVFPLSLISEPLAWFSRGLAGVWQRRATQFLAKAINAGG